MARLMTRRTSAGRRQAEPKRVIAAFEAASAEGRGVVTVDGRMIENLHVDSARRVLATAAAITRYGSG